MPGRSKRSKLELPQKQRREIDLEHGRVQEALLDTFERLWTERPKAKGNTQAATMQRAGLTPQSWGKWRRGTDLTLSSVVAVAYALDRRIEFDLPALSDSSDTVHVVTNEEGEPLSDDVLRLAQMLDELPDGPGKHRIFGMIEGAITSERAKQSPSGPAAEQRGHRGRGGK